MMGGEITIESVVGEGTTFHLTIQLAQSESSEVIMPSRQRVIGIKSGQLPSESW
jgi:chemotaxis protein histidine kinase CheA